MAEFKYELGARVKDVVTSFEGVATGRAQWLTGCNQYVVTPTELDKDGKRRDGEWLDENRLVSVEGKSFDFDGSVRERGGPQDVPPHRLG